MATIETETRANGIVVARFVNPPMNYLVAPQLERLRALLSEWRAPEVRCVVLTGGVPGKFITHYSVEELRALAGHPELRTIFRSAGEGFHRLVQGLRELPKPVLAALNGDAMGGGFELALSCDIRIAQEGDYRIGLPESKLAILPGGTGTQLLARLLGAGRAIELVLRGRVLSPREAAALGLVHEVAPDALARALEIAEELAGLSPLALAEIKACVYRGVELPLAGGLELERRAFVETLASPEARKAMDAYLALAPEKRRARLEGKP
jgi:enoyl-CoA hydratase